MIDIFRTKFCNHQCYKTVLKCCAEFWKTTKRMCIYNINTHFFRINFISSTTSYLTSYDFYRSVFLYLEQTDHLLNHNDRSTFKVKSKFIVETLKYPQNNRKGRLSNDNISNYGSIMYWKVTRDKKMVKLLRFHMGNFALWRPLVHN